MKMFYECDDILKQLHILHLVQFNRAEIDRELKKYLVKENGRMVVIAKKI